VIPRLFFALFCVFAIAQAQKTAPIEKMIGQMIAIGFEGENPNDEGAIRVISQIKKGEIGSAVIYAKNVKDPTRLRFFLETLRASIGNNPPLWIMIDQEGGIITRLNSKKGFSDYPTAAKIGEGSLDTAYATYRDLACELKGYAINFNLAPVVDLARDQNVISNDKRSFGSDPVKVAKYAERFIKAHDSCGVLTTLKHFPGHGSSKNDPHFGSSDATENYEEKEIIPFEILIKNKTAHSVMISHIVDRRFDELPATLSKKHIDRLRFLGFEGVAISDDLQMGAIAQNYDLNESVIKAIDAGNDILLFSNMLINDPEIAKKVLAIVKKAISDGLISESRIIESYNRIIALKYKRLN
jgi:beta-N-acetylhexosaminidase